ncbi:uncharacterized protein LOC136096317 [Hydra vulgaris]|uniref:uncharacterized protein LOC136096317 n=1 Tax=Hydra vulgaris TaxID=6087 RepID=UPI0032EA36EB
MAALNNFESLAFNFFEKEFFSQDENSDPDNNFYCETFSDCSYIFPSELEEYLFKNVIDKNSNQIRILHLNIRSLNSNFEKLLNLIEETKNLFNIICLTETWITSKDLNSHFQIPHFNIISLERQINKRGGGVLIYAHKTLRRVFRGDLSISDSDEEVLTIEIESNQTKNLLISCCYRPPAGMSENLSMFLHNVIKKGDTEKKKNILLGDFNMNCFLYNNDYKVKNFYDTFFETGSIPLINRPTRVTINSATLIDNIISTDIFNKGIKKGILKTDITDHFPIFVTIDTYTAKNIDNKKVLKKRIINQNNLNLFKDQLSLLHWNNININNNANDIYETFFKTFYSVYDANFPVIEIKAKPKSPKLSNKIPITRTLFSDFLLSLEKCICSDELSSYLSIEELEKALKSIKKNKSCGPDKIYGNVIIDCFKQLKDVLFKVFNASIKQGIFPEQLKIAKVTPIYKDGDQSQITNYRPISVLSVFSKILERIMYNRIYKHFDKNNLLYVNQFGFKKDSSTGHAIIQLVNEISKSFEQSKYTLGIFLVV